MVIYAVVAVNTVEGDAGNEGPFGHLDYFFAEEIAMGVTFVCSLFPLVGQPEAESVELADVETIASDLLPVAAAVGCSHELDQVVLIFSVLAPVSFFYWMQSDFPSQSLHTSCRLVLHGFLRCKIYTMLLPDNNISSVLFHHNVYTVYYLPAGLSLWIAVDMTH